MVIHLLDALYHGILEPHSKALFDYCVSPTGSSVTAAAEMN